MAMYSGIDLPEKNIKSIEGKGSVTVNEQSKSDWLLIFDFDFEVQFHCELTDLLEISGVFKP